MIFLFSLIPLVWIGLYNHPSADDFSESFLAHQAWSNTHNVFSMLSAAAEKAYGDYFEWMGYFTSNFLMALAPSLFSESAYIVTTPILLVLFIFSSRYMFRQILIKAIGMNTYYAESIICVILFALIQCMVQTGRTEMFYWYCSGSNYTMTHAMCMWFFGLLISFYYDNSNSKVKKAFKLAGLSVLGFFTGGGNMLTALNAVIIIVLMVLFWTFAHKFKTMTNCKLLLIPSVFCVYGLLCSVFAPGNATREAITSGMNPVKAIFVSFYDYLYYCIDRWLTWPIVLMLLLLIPIYWRGLNSCKYQFRYPILVIILGYGLTAAMMTPSLYAIGNMDAGRLQAMAYIMFIMTIFLSEGYIIGYICKRISIDAIKDRFSKKEAIYILSVMLFFAFSAALTVIPDNHYFSFSSAITDIANGSAKQYSNSLYDRIDLYMSGEKDVVVNKLPSEPKLLFFADLGGDYNAWARNAVCRYYDLNTLEWIDSEVLE